MRIARDLHDSAAHADQRDPRPGRRRPPPPGPRPRPGACGPDHDRGRRAGDDRRDRPADPRPARRRRSARRRPHDRAAGRPRRARDAGRRHRAAGQAIEFRVDGPARGAGARGRPGGVPDPPGVADERRPPRQRPGRCRDRLRRDRAVAAASRTRRRSAAAATAAADGHGVLGMRERAALLGGTIEAGRIDAAFRVVARLPYVAGGEP